MTRRANSVYAQPHGRGLLLIYTVLILLLGTSPSNQPAAQAQSETLTPFLQHLAKQPTNALQATQAQVAVAGSGPLLIGNDGMLLASVRVAQISPALEQALARAGFVVKGRDAKLGYLYGLIAPRQLSELSRVNGVLSVMESYAPVSLGGAEALGASGFGTTQAQSTPAQSCGLAIGDATTEGVAVMRADLARALSLAGGGSVDGSGVTIGILSDSFDQAKGFDPTLATTAITDVLRGDLPGEGNPCGYTTPVSVLREFPTDLLALGVRPTDEARAMAQIVHDIAPGARIIVGSAFSLSFGAGMAQVIRDMRAAGADIIVDDVGFQSQTAFQDDPVSIAVDEVTADGAIYLTAAGNLNRVSPTATGLKDMTSYATLAYRPTACPTLTFSSTALVLPGDCHDFNPDPNQADASYRATIAPNSLVSTRMQWGEPWFGITTDLNFYWFDEATGEVLPNGRMPTMPAAGNQDSLTTQRGLEGDILITSGAITRTWSLLINRAQGNGTPAIALYNFAGNGVLLDAEYLAPNAPATSADSFGNTFFGHRAARGAIAIGAVAYNTPDQLEVFSSRGDPLILFGPLVGTSPAPRLATPELRQKPEVLATNGGANTFFGRAPRTSTNPSDFWRFFGTSAAAPHSAGVAALILQQARASGINLTPSEMEQLLRNTARPLAERSAWEQGAGLLDALNGVQALRPVTSTGLLIDVPTAEAVANAGAANAPQSVSVIVRTALLGLSRTDFTVNIGDAAGSIVSVAALSGTYALEIQPPPQAAAGVYDLSVGVNLNGTTVVTASSNAAVEYRQTGTTSPRLSTYLDQQNYRPGEAIEILATVSNGSVVSGSSVIVNLRVPLVLQGLGGPLLPLRIELFDDGMHNDGAANDNVYGNTLSGRLSAAIGAGNVLVETQATSEGGRLISLNVVQIDANSGPSPIDVGAPPSTVFAPLIAN